MTDPNLNPPPIPEPEIGGEIVPLGIPVQTQVHEPVVAADGRLYVPVTVKVPGATFSFALEGDHARRFANNITRKAIATNGGGLQIARAMPPEPPRG